MGDLQRTLAERRKRISQNPGGEIKIPKRQPKKPPPEENRGFLHNIEDAMQKRHQLNKGDDESDGQSGSDGWSDDGQK